MASNKKSSKVSEDKENSPEDASSSEIESEDQSQGDTSESSDEKLMDADADDAVAVDPDAMIEDAEIVSEAEEVGDETNSEETPPSAPLPPSSPAVEPGGSKTSALVFGGLIAGAIGFLVATFVVPEGWPRPAGDPNEAVKATLDSQAGQIEALVAQIAEIESASESGAADVDLTSIDAGLSELSARIDALAEEMATVALRTEELENAPTPIIAPAPDVDFDAEMDTFRAELEAAAEAARAEVAAAQARAAEIEADAQAAAELATRNAALAEVSAALESGSPFAEALGVLPEAPAALTSVAGDGVPTLAALRAAFPDAARGALRDVQDVPSDASATDRVAAFFRKQTNARSLSPREGDDPDAILSRSEAALNDGDLSAALVELSGLPDAATQSLSGWISEAETRIAAMQAVQSLSNELN